MMSELKLQELTEKLFEDISVVESIVAYRRGSVNVYLVLEKSGGITVDDLTLVQRVLRPRLEIEFGREKLLLEIASPGLGRKIKKNREYRIFIGRRVAVLVDDEWTRGTIVNADEESVILETEQGLKKIPFANIVKGKLDPKGD